MRGKKYAGEAIGLVLLWVWLLTHPSTALAKMNHRKSMRIFSLYNEVFKAASLKNGS